jgi:branched-chain amino acid aminotransferase
VLSRPILEKTEETKEEYTPMHDIAFTRNPAPKPKPADQSALGFGLYYTDHMFLMNYDEGRGWHDPRIVPYGPISLDPAAMCLHYGQEVFEGLKAYYGADGRVRLFRPWENMARLNLSCERLCIPPVDEALGVRAIEALVQADRDWIPTAEGTSLYIRPFIFATESHVGVRPAKQLLFAVILSPVGAYYPTGLNPVKIYIERSYVRAVRGGIGFTKAGGNYASSLKAQEEAHALGYAQVLWLDGVERKYIEEVGTMNVFFVIGDEVVTPALQGSILGGITRKSCVDLLRGWGMRVAERPLALEELLDAAKSGRLKEAFGTGTAAVISPIGELRSGDEVITVNNGEIGAVSQRLYDELTGIQWGKAEDKYGWTKIIA